MDLLQSSPKIVLNGEHTMNEQNRTHNEQRTDYYPYSMPHASISAKKLLKNILRPILVQGTLTIMNLGQI